jgi:alkylation response protein AidB-like acyl-CoA dehydrogenase
MDRAIELTREYLLQRQQFGVAIASFQSLRHRLADMLIAQAQARATLHGAVAALVDDEAQSRERVRALAIAKAQSGRSGRFIGAQAIQLHGGIGMADETMVGHCFKQLMVFDAQHGNTAAQLRVLADGLNGDRPRATNSWQPHSGPHAEMFTAASDSRTYCADVNCYSSAANRRTPNG